MMDTYYPESKTLNQTGRESKKVLEYIEQTTGVTNRQLVEDIKAHVAPDNDKVHTVSPIKYFATST